MVFSNPQADTATLKAYYARAYYETHWPAALQSDKAAAAKRVALQCEEINRLKAHAPGGRFLEIGSGAGYLLAAAQAAGFEPWGVEPSEAAAATSRSLFGFSNISCGLLSDTAYDDGQFDVVYAWHVIEHVLDLNEFVGEIHRVLRPGGVLWIGTETYRNFAHYTDRLSRTLIGRPAPFATSTEHTFVFTTQTLADSLRRRGFEVMLCEAYQPTWREKMQSMRFRWPVSWGWFALQHLANKLFRTGPLLRLAARRL